MNEAAIGSAGATDVGGHPGRSRSEPAPLQSRAQFLQNWDWSSVAQINGGLCERGGAQRGFNSETHAAVAAEWEKRRASALTLLETFQFLRSCHRRAPILEKYGRVVWRPDGTASELSALPESLLREPPREKAAS